MISQSPVYKETVEHRVNIEKEFLALKPARFIKVMLRYGKFSNATLLRDFGFTLPYNIYDEVQLWMDVPSHDPLYAVKIELVNKHRFRRGTKSDGFPFIIKNAFNGIWGIPFAGGVAVFCFEGFSMTLALEASMAEKRKFRGVLSQAFLGITFTYICFGIFGYLAYGDETRDIITLNLPNNWSAAAVKVGLSIALIFTFPIMMHPIHEIVEAKLRSSGWFQKLCHNIQVADWLGLHGSRILVVAVLSVLASFIPGFGALISFVGSTACALLSFVLPAAFHLFIMGRAIGFWQRALDYGILITGLAFAGYGTYDAVLGHSSI